MTEERKHYDQGRCPMALGEHYTNHLSAMTSEDLRGKSKIAAELAWRDQRIEELEALVESFRRWPERRVVTVVWSKAEE